MAGVAAVSGQIALLHVLVPIRYCKLLVHSKMLLTDCCNFHDFSAKHLKNISKTTLKTFSKENFKLHESTWNLFISSSLGREKVELLL